ncbi:hypothetical protein CPB86DRAFT_634132 [Serendipita vermifera]|nr:hypothetical protein CPB86DRAFT_634132 [Serendipita vermifera]
MTFTLFTLSTLVTSSALFTIVRGSPVPQLEIGPVLCKTMIQSHQGDTCRSIGGAFGIYDYSIQQGNTFLNCNDIWTGTQICIPDVSDNRPVIYPEDLSTNPRCQAQQYSLRGDDCRSIGNQWGLYDYQIWNANSWVNCNDLWPGTLLCIPNPAREPTIVDTPSTISATSSTTSVASSRTVSHGIPLPTPSRYCASTYTSKQGDTCQSIGRRWGLSAEEILGSNSFLNCNDIWINTPICIPYWRTIKILDICGARHISIQGDTCSSIASQYGIVPSYISMANSFVNCDDIWVGTPICVPSFYPGTFDPPCQETYTSIHGDTCSTIANKYSELSGDEILIANPHLNCDDIWAGTPICIPIPVVMGPPMPSRTSLITAMTPMTPTSASQPVPTRALSVPTAVFDGCAATYISKQGDTCRSIGRRWGITAEEVRASNSLLNCDNIWENTPICIPYLFFITNIPFCGARYISVQGDSCDSIASQYGLTSDEISSANSFLNCNDIWVGTPICITTFYPGKFDPPCQDTYISVQGDTCTTIANRYSGSDWGQIKMANPYLDCNDIWIGTPICVPIPAKPTYSRIPMPEGPAITSAQS